MLRQMLQDIKKVRRTALNVSDIIGCVAWIACRSKAKTKPQRREPAGYSPRIIPMNARKWIDIEPRKWSFSDDEVSKKVTYLLRHSQQVHREEDGAVHFWRIKENLQNQFPQSPHWSDGRWKACLAAGGGDKRRFQYCTDASGTIVYFRALQGHSGRNLIDPSLQDNVVISGFFQHIYHVGCAFNLHSIISSELIPGGKSSSKRQTVFFLPVDPVDKSHKDPNEIDLNVPRHERYLHNAWKRHQDAVYWVDINLAIKKGLTFYQTRSNAIILQGILPAYCIPKVVRLKTGEVSYEKAYMSPRPPPKISLCYEWTKELGSKIIQQPEGEVVLQTKFFQSTQLIPNPTRDRSGRPDEMQDERKMSRSQEISVNFLTKNPVLQIEQGDLLKHRKLKHVHLKTARVSMLSRLMIEQGDLLMTQLQYKTTLKKIMRPERSTLTMKHFVKE